MSEQSKKLRQLVDLMGRCFAQTRDSPERRIAARELLGIALAEVARTDGTGETLEAVKLCLAALERAGAPK